jgi:hypothetical protein
MLGLPDLGLPAGLLEHAPTDRHDHPRLLGETDEVGRREQSPGGMGPAHEGLEPGDPSAREPDDRLVVNPKLLALDGPAEVAL